MLGYDEFMQHRQHKMHHLKKMVECQRRAMLLTDEMKVAMSSELVHQIAELINIRRPDGHPFLPCGHGNELPTGMGYYRTQPSMSDRERLSAEHHNEPVVRWLSPRTPILAYWDIHRTPVDTKTRWFLTDATGDLFFQAPGTYRLYHIPPAEFDLIELLAIPVGDTTEAG